MINKKKKVLFVTMMFFSQLISLSLFANTTKEKNFKRTEFIEDNSERVLRIEVTGTSKIRKGVHELVSLSKYEVRSCDKELIMKATLEGDRTTDLCDEALLSLGSKKEYQKFEFHYQKKINRYLMDNGILRTEANFMMSLMSVLTAGAVYFEQPIFPSGKITIGVVLLVGAYYFKDTIQAYRTVSESRKLYRSFKSGLYVNSFKDELIDIETLTDILITIDNDRKEAAAVDEK